MHIETLAQFLKLQDSSRTNGHVSSFVLSPQMQMSWLSQQKIEEVNRKDRTGMNYIKSRSNQGVRQTV